MSRIADIIGTLRTSFSIGPKGANATFSASGITAARTLTLPNKTGTLACTSDIPASGVTRAVAQNIMTMRAY